MRNGTGGGTAERWNEGTEQLQIVEEPVMNGTIQGATCGYAERK